MQTVVLTKVTEIRKGDRLAVNYGWAALDDAWPTEDVNFNPGVTLRVRYADGDDGFRHWDDRNIEIKVIR